MAFWLDIAAFALKAFLIVAAIGGLAALIAWLARGEGEVDSELKVESLNELYDERRRRIEAEILDKKERKALAKSRKRAAKTRPPSESDKRVYVLNFKGDLAASSVKRLAQEVDAVLTIARPRKDEVVLRVDSPGGSVAGYGLGAAQLMRLRQASVALTICVDQVAASGGYLMACVGEKILAAPFALVGSIGVVAQVPNDNRLLKKNDIDFEEMTAGEYKRTVSIFGEITPAGREHFRGKLDDTHAAFKQFVRESRPKLDVDRIANGDVWLGREALALGLVDELTTSDDYLFRARDSARLFALSLSERKPWLQQLLSRFGFLADAARAALARFGLLR